MQSLCLNACLEAGFRKKEWSQQKIPDDSDFFKRVCTRTALTVDYSSTVGKMKEGPKTRGTERKTYRLKDENDFDVYPIVLRAVAFDPPELTHRYPNLQWRIEQICEGDVPVGSSVTGSFRTPCGDSKRFCCCASYRMGPRKRCPRYSKPLSVVLSAMV
jgi:hypothetical protein